MSGTNKQPGIASAIKGVFKSSSSVIKRAATFSDVDATVDQWKKSVANVDISSLLPEGETVDAFWSEMSEKMKKAVKHQSGRDKSELDAEESACWIGKSIAEKIGAGVHSPVIIVPGFTSS